MPLYFIENRGQLDSRVAYYVQGRDTSVYFAKRGITFALTEEKPSKTTNKPGIRKASLPLGQDASEPSKRWAVKLDFLDANPNVRISAAERTSAVISYFKGPREQWKTGLPTYASLTYQDLWPGIDLVYSGTTNRLKYSLVVKPGADPNQIRLAYRGATDVRLDVEGRLRVETPVGGFSDDRPYSYQEVAGRRIEVATEYAIERTASSTGREYRFDVASYDRSRPLILDPAVLVYAGYIGGASDEGGNSDNIAVDVAGNAYVTGRTGSAETTFPVTVGPDLTSNGGTDAFVAKVKADGTGLAYAGYIGGAADDGGYGIAVDALGNAYVTGFTGSNEATFPVIVGPDLTWNGANDAFVAKVNAAGTGLDYAGYIGGASTDVGNSIAVDATGNAYVAGITSSSEATFPVAVGPDLTHNGGTDDAFVAKINAAGTALDYAGYIGGASGDGAYGIAVDAAGGAYVTGFATSTEATFPVAVGPDLTFNGGPYDAFVAKVNAAGTGLDYAGYIGGDNFDSASSIAVDEAGNAYVTGNTISNENTFPVFVGPDLTFNGFPNDAFVAKVNAAGTGLPYAGYIGGSSDDYGLCIAVDAAGNAYVAGRTNSTEATFPVAVGPDLTFNGGVQDAFVAMVNAAGTGLGYAGYIGGASDESSSGIAVDAAGNAYVTGRTGSDEATFPVTVGPDLTFNGGSYDTFVAKISSVIPPTPTPTPTSTPVPPTATPTDTPTPPPTDTPIPPTNTPTSTPTPTSTATPVPAPTYVFTGFFSPVDNPPVINNANAGQGIAVKWRITDSNGNGISDPASFVNLTSGSMTCSSTDPQDAIETYTGNSGLQYLGDGYWQFNWRTPRSYAGTCRVMSLNLADGPGTLLGRTAKFQFR